MTGSDPKIPDGEDVEGHLTEPALFNLFRATLQYPIRVEDQARKLCMDIDFLIADSFLVPDEEVDHEYRTPIDNIRNVILVLSCYLPPDHSWQDALVLAVETLRKREGEMVPGDKEWGGLHWSELPEFSSSVRMTHDAGENFPSKDSDGMPMYTFENFTSFVARLCCEDYFPGFDMAVSSMQETLEASLTPEMNSRLLLWTITEWLIRCPGLLYTAMTGPKNVSDEDVPAGYHGGPLCPDIVPFSQERWDFWRTRLLVMKENGEVNEYGGDIAARVDKSLAAMDAVART